MPDSRYRAMLIMGRDDLRQQNAKREVGDLCAAYNKNQNHQLLQ